MFISTQLFTIYDVLSLGVYGACLAHNLFLCILICCLNSWETDFSRNKTQIRNNLYSCMSCATSFSILWQIWHKNKPLSYLLQCINEFETEPYNYFNLSKKLVIEYLIGLAHSLSLSLSLSLCLPLFPIYHIEYWRKNVSIADPSLLSEWNSLFWVLPVISTSRASTKVISTNRHNSGDLGNETSRQIS